MIIQSLSSMGKVAVPSLIMILKTEESEEMKYFARSGLKDIGTPEAKKALSDFKKIN